MSAIYDNWERLVAAVLKKEQLRQLCYADSIATSVGSLAYSSILSPRVQNTDTSVSSQILGSISRYSQSCSSVVMHDGFTTVVRRLRGSDVAPLHDSYFSYEDEMLVIYELQSLDGASTLPHGKKHGIHQLNWEPRVRIAIAVANAIANNHDSLLVLSGIDDLENMEAASSIVILPTAGYRAPEVMNDEGVEGHPSKASDVYSFGVLLLELLTGDKLVIRGEGLVRWAIRKFQEVGTLIVFEFVRVRDSNKLIDMWKMFLVAMRCVEGKPETRPEMLDVLKMMEGIKT